MEHSVLEISASPKQISKLRNGHKVRVKPAMKGKGVCVAVDPLKYSIVSRTFAKGKGSELQLSPQELQMNKMGKGICGGDIFDKIADKVADKAIDTGFKLLEKKLSGKGVKGGSLTEKLVDRVADRAIDKGISVLENRVSTRYGIGMKGKQMKGNGADLTDKIIEKVSDKAIDAGFKLLEKKLSGKGMRFEKGSKEAKEYMASIRRKKGGMKGEGDFFGNIGKAFTASWQKPPATKAEQDMANFVNQNMIGAVPSIISEINPKWGERAAIPINPYLEQRKQIDNSVSFGSGLSADTIQKLNQYLGTNMDYLKQAGLEDAISNAMSSSLIREAVDKAKSVKEDMGMGLYAGGTGLYASSSRGRAVTSQVAGSKMIPNFLESKPFFENNQLRYTLPVSYQKFHK